MAAIVAGALVSGLAPSQPAAGLALAALLCVLLPARVGAGEEEPARPGRGLAEAGALLLGGGLVAGLRFSGSAAASASLYLALFALALAGIAAWRRGGQAWATGLGALALGFPYLAGPFLGDANPETALDLALHSPLAVLCGTCSGLDVLRQGSLYQVFPAAQSLPYAYPSLGAACLPLAVLAALAWAPRLPRPSARGGRLISASAALALVLAASAPAQAQGLFPPPTTEGGGGGGLETRVRLGYYLANIEGFHRVDPNSPREPGVVGARFSYRRNLDLNQAFAIPTFEVELAWKDTGAIRLQYLENIWTGEDQVKQPFRYEEQLLQRFQQIDTRYRFRTISLRLELEIPIASFLKLKLVTTQRYVKNEIKIRASPQLFSVRNSQEAIVPTVGAAADIFIWNVIHAYGDIQWLDFRTSWLGAQDKRWAFRYREWRVGVRLELVEHAHVMVEWYDLFLDIKDGDRDVERYQTHLQGVRVLVAVLF